MKSKIMICLIFIITFISEIYSQSDVNNYLNQVKEKISISKDTHFIIVPFNTEEIEVKEIISLNNDEIYFKLDNNIISTINTDNVHYIKSNSGQIFFDYEKYERVLLTAIKSINIKSIKNILSESGKSLKSFRKLYYTGTLLNIFGTVLIIADISLDLGVVSLCAGSIITLASFYYIGEAGDILIYDEE